MGDDHVSGRGQVVGAAATGVHEADDHRSVRAGLEVVQFAPHDVRGRHRPAGAVEAQDHCTCLAIGGHRVQLFAEEINGVLPLQKEPYCFD